MVAHWIGVLACMGNLLLITPQAQLAGLLTVRSGMDCDSFSLRE